MNASEVKLFLDLLLSDKTEAEQIVILRDCLEEHAFNHPWADEGLVNSICENIAQEYEIEWDIEEEDEG